jgi:DNA-binding NtrC family response regulator
MVSDFKVLFIIDKPEFLNKEIDILYGEGYQVVTESYSSDVVSKLPAINPDLVVSDIFFLDENSASLFNNRDKENSLTSFFIFIGKEGTDKNLNLDNNWPVEIMIRPYSQKYFLQRVKTYENIVNREINVISKEKKVEEHQSEQKKFDQQRTEFWKMT